MNMTIKNHNFFIFSGFTLSYIYNCYTIGRIQTQIRLMNLRIKNLENEKLN